MSALVQVEFDNNHRIYGSPHIAQALKEKQYNISRSYIARLMKKMHLRSKVRKR